MRPAGKVNGAAPINFAHEPDVLEFTVLAVLLRAAGLHVGTSTKEGR